MRIDTRPYTPDQVDDMYERAQKVGRNPVARLGFHVFGRKYKPTVSFEGRTAEILQEHRALGGVAIMTCTHRYRTDQFEQVGAVMQYPKILGDFYANVSSPAKPDLLNEPGLAGLAQRYAMLKLGAVIAWRDQDLPANREVLPPGTPRQETAKLMHALTNILMKGRNVNFFPGGTRDPDNPHEAGAAQSGVGHLAFYAQNLTRLLILPSALYYGEDPEHPNYKSPHLAFVEPHLPRFDSPAHVVSLVDASAQHAQDIAAQQYHARAA